VSGAESRVLAEEQAALRRVATLVARDVPPDEVFAAVTVEVVRLLPVDFARMGRYESDGTVTTVAASGRTDDHFPVGRRLAPGWKNLGRIVAQTGRSARVDSVAGASGPVGITARQIGVHSAVATPIIVEGGLWGVMAAGSTLEQLLPADTEARLASFTELVATAIANAESRASLARLAEEQAALRRVATLVARGAASEKVFAAVAEEVGQLFLTDLANMSRYESDGTFTIVASAGNRFPVGSRWPLGGKTITTIVFETGRPARFDSYADVTGTLADDARGVGLRSAVATPITAEGRLWGVIGVGSSLEQPLPADTEARLASFTELVATAIANAESRATLAASRARIVAASDQARRRIEHDLHDGAQQRLVSLGLGLRAAQKAVPPGQPELRQELGRLARGTAEILEELREISRGIHPAVLSLGGLGLALKALARRSPVPVKLDVRVQARLPERAEVAAYFVVSEALANVAKHARASVVEVQVEVRDGALAVSISDDGIGGADPSGGSGLIGLTDRVEASGGTISISSHAGAGTQITAQLPIAS